MRLDIGHDRVRDFVWCAVAACMLLLGALYAVVPSSSPAAVLTHQLIRDPVVVVYGDSLMSESQSWVVSMLDEAHPAGRVIVRSFPGTAPCDWFDAMRRDAVLRPDVIVLEFAGNGGTRCIAQRAGSEAALLRAYRADATRAVKILQRANTHAEIVFVATPRRATSPLISGSNPLDAVYRSVAAASARKVTFSAAPERALASNDRAGRLVFRPTLPCLPGERQRSECVDGQILVRSADRMHLCAAFGAGVGCAGYASGVVRFGNAVTSVVLKTLGEACTFNPDPSPLNPVRVVCPSSAPAPGAVRTARPA